MILWSEKGHLYGLRKSFFAIVYVYLNLTIVRTKNESSVFTIRGQNNIKLFNYQNRLEENKILRDDFLCLGPMSNLIQQGGKNYTQKVFTQ